MFTKIGKAILSPLLLLFVLVQLLFIVGLIYPLQLSEKLIAVIATEVEEDGEKAVKPQSNVDTEREEILPERGVEIEKPAQHAKVEERLPHPEPVKQGQGEKAEESSIAHVVAVDIPAEKEAEVVNQVETPLQQVKQAEPVQEIKAKEPEESPTAQMVEAEDPQQTAEDEGSAQKAESAGQGQSIAERTEETPVVVAKPSETKNEAVLQEARSEKVYQPNLKLFPRPDSLKPAIRFWTMVFTEADSKGGYIHDDRRMDIVYERLYFDFDWDGGQRQIKNATYKYRKILKTLAGGKRKDLSCDEQRVLKMWGEDTSARTFRRAAERLHFQRGISDRFVQGLIRSGTWKPYIREVLAKHELPLEIAALPHLESGFRPTVWSLVGAAGLWQFMPATGRRFMRVDHVIDERMDPFKATESAARLLKYNYSTIGSWPLALTAYNHGLGGMLRAVKRTKTKDIGKIVQRYRGRSFGFASRNFYVSFLAALDASENAEKYYGEVVVNPAIQPSDYRLTAYVPAEALAESLDIEIGDLKKLNPALRDAVWNGSKYIPKDYRLNLPDDWDQQETQDELLWAAYEIGFAKQKQDLFHKVVRGDSLSTIAQKYGVSVKSLKAINDIGKKNRIRVGKRLKLPLSKAPAKPTVSAKAAKAKANKKAEGKKSQTASLSADPFDYSVRNGRIKIQPGETLGHIAAWSGVTSKRLLSLNRLKSAKSVVFGRKIRLDFSKVKRRDFEKARIAFHKKRQTQYFRQHRIANTRTHKTRAGESLWRLAIKRYRIPLWLLCQYNPNLEVGQMLPEGTRVRIPVVKRLSRQAKT